jgi:ankyrin repeat protein
MDDDPTADDLLSIAGANIPHVSILTVHVGMTNNLLQWNKDLCKEGDKTKGSTPLHFAASCGFRERVTSLLDADKSIAYQFEKDGSFPIHVAVIGRQASVVTDLLRKCPDCAQLRDAKGKTFLHIAAQLGYLEVFDHVSPLLRGNPNFASIINIQDDDGNTGLHLAVLAGTLKPFYRILSDKDVMLNLSNSEGKTALDLAQSKIPTGVQFGLVGSLILVRI